jgi:LmbE family N-acetylglucosaminyl deacetylase
MATLVTFHAHPDDEAIANGGTMAAAVAAGHRVVLVTATRGENGEVAEGFLAPGEKLWERREKELQAAAEVLGVSRVEFLGYVDSGMMGTPENDVPESFWKADADVATRRLAEILVEERADILTVYDEEGTYGHPDHIQVHRIGVRAAAEVGTPKVYETVIPRSLLEGMGERLRELGIDPPGGDDNLPPGVPDELITTRVDVHEYLEVKRAAMEAHPSQIADTSFFLAMPPEMFAGAFGVEHYVLRGAPPGTQETSLFEGLGD